METSGVMQSLCFIRGIQHPGYTNKLLDKKLLPCCKNTSHGKAGVQVQSLEQSYGSKFASTISDLKRNAPECDQNGQATLQYGNKRCDAQLMFHSLEQSCGSKFASTIRGAHTVAKN